MRGLYARSDRCNFQTLYDLLFKGRNGDTCNSRGAVKKAGTIEIDGHPLESSRLQQLKDMHALRTRPRRHRERDMLV